MSSDDRRLIVFRSRLRAGVEQAYLPRADTMFELARSMPGFVSADDFVAEDGERVAIIEFESPETLAAWREHPEHRLAQAEGRDRWYASYRLSVCRILRESRFDQRAAPAAAADGSPRVRKELTGGCACGAIRYEISGKPWLETSCHCNDCRRACGATPVAWATFETSAFVVLCGSLRERASSARARRGFCGDCGCQITFAYVAHPELFDLTIASLDDPNAVAPKSHTWVRSKPDWVAIGDDLPRYPGAHPEDAGVSQSSD